MTIFTIGSTKKTARSFFGALRDSGAKRIVDVRLNTGSQLAGFAKRDDLVYFLEKLCGMGYVSLPVLAPTRAMFDAYKKRGGKWQHYEAEFLELMKDRRIEDTVPCDTLADACLLCSEHEPDRCHRRLVVEYLAQHWPNVTIEHL